MPRLQIPNCRDSQIRIHSQLRIEHWVQLLVDYHDRDLLDWLKFGFPLGYVKSPPKTCVWNYPSVWHHCDAINTYIEKELSHGALIGPFDTPPYNTWSHLNPCITRDKDGGKGKHVIFNLSEGLALSVNGGIPDSVLDSVYRKGRGCLLFSLDVTRAYRILQLDLFCMLVTSLVTKVYFLRTGWEVYVHIDDFCGGEADPDGAWDSYNRLIELLISVSTSPTTNDSHLAPWLYG